jgi:hypothetical protein
LLEYDYLQMTDNDDNLLNSFSNWLPNKNAWKVYRKVRMSKIIGVEMETVNKYYQVNIGMCSAQVQS